MCKVFESLALVIFFAVHSITPIQAFSALAETNFSRLRESLSSPSGKLTLSPELVLPEPTDPTALLLQSTEIQKLSERIRTQAKANSAWISASLNNVQTFSVEQEDARGNFPGPVPIIFCPSSKCTEEEMQSLAEAGTAGILVSLQGGDEIASVQDLSLAEEDKITCTTARDLGLQPIPEIVLSDETAASMSEDDVVAMVESLKTELTFDPVGVLLTINSADDDDDDDDDTSEENDSEEEESSRKVSLPPIPKSLKRKTPILGSIRVAPGENRMGMETAHFSKAGFTGAILRADCVPGFRMNPDLDVVGRFWSACIGDLKSTKSKNFSFRAKNQMNKSLPNEWAKYQMDVMGSGALGAMEDNYTEVDEKSGEFMGF